MLYQLLFLPRARGKLGFAFNFNYLRKYAPRARGKLDIRPGEGETAVVCSARARETGLLRTSIPSYPSILRARDGNWGNFQSYWRDHSILRAREENWVSFIYKRVQYCILRAREGNWPPSI